VPQRRHIDTRHRARGVALVAVLLLIAGLIAIATAIVTLSVSQRRAAQRAYEADARRELLDGALRVALAEISNSKPNGPFWHPREPRQVSIGGKHVEVNLERESGRIDINTADPKYLIAALAVMGRSETEARAGAARIRDWIDADDEPGRDGGAERREYQEAHLSYEPRNAPFESVEELRQVLGLQDLSDQQLDSFTVYSQQLEPYAAEAPTTVRDALAWLAKSAGEGGANSPLPPPLTNSGESVSYAGSVIRLRACQADDPQAPCRVTVQRITGSLRNPFQIFLWR
jgi:general secretion pathway protein K